MANAFDACHRGGLKKGRLIPKWRGHQNIGFRFIRTSDDFFYLLGGDSNPLQNSEERRPNNKGGNVQTARFVQFKSSGFFIDLT